MALIQIYFMFYFPLVANSISGEPYWPTNLAKTQSISFIFPVLSFNCWILWLENAYLNRCSRSRVGKLMFKIIVSNLGSVRLSQSSDFESSI